MGTASSMCISFRPIKTCPSLLGGFVFVVRQHADGRCPLHPEKKEKALFAAVVNHKITMLHCFHSGKLHGLAFHLLLSTCITQCWLHFPHGTHSASFKDICMFVTEKKNFLLVKVSYKLVLP